MTRDQLRKHIRKYLNYSEALSQNELERRCGLGKGYLSHYLKGKDMYMKEHQYRKLIDIVSPWMMHHGIVAASIRKQLLMKGFNETDMAHIGLIVADMANRSNVAESDICQRSQVA